MLIRFETVSGFRGVEPEYVAGEASVVRTECDSDGAWTVWAIMATGHSYVVGRWLTKEQARTMVNNLVFKGVAE